MEEAAEDPVTVECSRDELADELEALRERLRRGEEDQRRGAGELALVRHEIGLVRARLRDAPPENEGLPAEEIRRRKVAP
jgi:hypothetical protein